MPAVKSSNIATIEHTLSPARMRETLESVQDQLKAIAMWQEVETPRRLIAEINAALCGTLTVEFVSGAIYDYYDVPFSTYKKMLRTDSCGHFFAESVSHNFKFRRIK